MNILAEIRSRFAHALENYECDPVSLVQQITPSGNPQFGDYQANLAMRLAGQLRRDPLELAQELVEAVTLDDMCHPLEIAGKGFINMKLKDEWIKQLLQNALLDERLGVAPTSNPLTFVVDFSSPNVAKPMHVGHIRSTVIGDALSRTLRFIGHHVITDNHLGDWGTQFGMIIYGYKHFVDKDAYANDAIGELSRLYRLVRQVMDFHAGRNGLAKMEEGIEKQAAALGELEDKIKEADKPAAKKLRKERNRLQDKNKELKEKVTTTKELILKVEQNPELLETAEQHEGIANAVLEETAKLHAGDEENNRLWHEFLPHCLEDLHRIYDKLGVSFDHEHGESFYQPMLGSVVDELKEKGLSKESQGAQCVFLDDFETPMIVQKQDGAFLYATSDLATVRYRVKEWNPDKALYVVDHRQHEHFEKLFAVAKLCGYDSVDLVHVAFGTVMGEDGTPFKTRSGDTVGLEGLLDEAVSRALTVVESNTDQDFDEVTQQRIATVVGIGALKYADLSQNRSTDYKFSYDNMLAMKGNTGPYLQYSYARNQGIFTKGNVDIAALRNDDQPLILDSPEERALGLALIRLEEALNDVTVDFRPNLLCNYVYSVSTIYSSFFDKCHVLKAPNEELKISRLKLCDLTARTVKQCLELLGIQVSERM